MIRILLDTNVLIDYVARREPYFDDVLKLRIAQVFGDVEWWASPHSYIDALYILRRYIDAEKVCSALLASLKFTHLATLDEDNIRLALSSGWADAEDCVVANCASAVDVDYLVTRNVSDFENSTVRCVTPKELLSILEEKYGLLYDEVVM